MGVSTFIHERAAWAERTAADYEYRVSTSEDYIQSSRVEHMMIRMLHAGAGALRFLDQLVHVDQVQETHPDDSIVE